MEAAPTAWDDAPAWDAQVDDNNVPGLNRPATTPPERHMALTHAVVNVWTTADIGTIRRIESEGRSLWVMWERTTVLPG